MNVFAYEQDDRLETPPLASKMRGIKLRQGQAVRLGNAGWWRLRPQAERCARGDCTRCATRPRQ